MIFNFENVKDYLKSEFEYRVKKNSRYSLRSFAQFLKVHPAELSQIFSSQRKLSLTSAVKVAHALNLSPTETKHLMWMLQSEKGRQLGLPLEIKEEKITKEIDLELFAKHSNWYHFAILNMIDMKSFVWSARDIAKRLGIGQSEAQVAMNDLVQSGLVHIEERARKIHAQSVEVKSELPSFAIRKYHRQMLEKANTALDEIQVELREFQSIGFVAQPEHIESIKKEIRQFSQTLAKKYHKVGGKAVYQIQVCLFPLTKESSS